MIICSRTPNLNPQGSWIILDLHSGSVLSHSKHNPLKVTWESAYSLETFRTQIVCCGRLPLAVVA